MTFTIAAGSLDLALENAYSHLEARGFAASLWQRRVEMWSGDDDVQQNISKRLGWLDAVDEMRPQAARLRALANTIKDEGFRRVVLLGMGGSSLAPEVLRGVIGVSPGYPEFHVLDSVDPDAVTSALVDAGTSLFIVASKSGLTIEVSSLMAEAERRVAAAGRPEPGAHFVAITDADTPLHRRAQERRFRDVFINRSDVGGRYSALTYFSLVPAALMGIDIDALLSSTQSMVNACRIADPRKNPGVALGAAIAAAAQHGRDKLTLLTDHRLERLGLWVEQLIAESTGKQGLGIVPVMANADDAVDSDDRLLVRTTLAGLDAQVRTSPTVFLDVPDLGHLGAEFFRWEVATATAGWLLGVNPFDEPNVQEAKDATRTLLAAYRSARRLPIAEPDAVIDGIHLSTSAAMRSALGGEPPLALLRVMQPHDYFGLLAYLPPDDQRFDPVISEFRAAVAAKARCAATIGYGPRYLHSTGQLHKGGPNTGVFVIVTAEPAHDAPVPGEDYTFGILQMAQALGDFQSLNRLGRRVLHAHLPRRNPALLQRLTQQILNRG